MNVTAATREDYFLQAGVREDDLRQLDAIIRECAPSLAPVIVGGMSGMMLGYGLQSYQTKSMKQPSEWPLVAVAVQKHYVSLYVCAVVDGQYLAERYASELGKVSCGKSCIRFKTVSDLELPGLRALLEELEARVHAGQQLFGR